MCRFVTYSTLLYSTLLCKSRILSYDDVSDLVTSRDIGASKPSVFSRVCTACSLYCVCGTISKCLRHHTIPIHAGPPFGRRLLFSSSFAQLSIEEFLMNPEDPYDKDHELLRNPLSAEFGVRTATDMESLVQDTLPDFKLVKTSFFAYLVGTVARAQCSTVDITRKRTSEQQKLNNSHLL